MKAKQTPYALSGTQVFGPTRINVHALLEGLRQQGDVVLIGSETGITENKWIRCVHSCGAKVWAVTETEVLRGEL